jgi:hypothetical protein
MTLVVKRRTVSKPVKTKIQGDPEEMTVLEGTDPAQNPPQGVTINVNGNEPKVPVELSAELQALVDQRVENARKEEKEKLYPEIERLKGVVGELSSERETRLAAEAEAQAEAERLEEERRQSELTLQQRMEERDRTWEERFTAMQLERDREAALREREGQVAALIRHRDLTIAQNEGRIEPRLIPYITGNTPEEIDQAVARAIADTDAIAADFAEATGQQRRQVIAPISGLPSTPVADLLANPGDRQVTLSPDDIRNMPMDDYMANRQAILEAARQRGPYG